ncbi:hypothetical protein Cni_G09810 [Canna indica]|uniref:VQ domain-containing protein n=1 Tax=Canna indica TaxID=4628 RepID=A0AAQ3K6D3_9LILI|nr:hypothetical protein Cni_G09810 [Canna indica]
MDSSNSGSIQSSSSGDNEEYDSRGESISSFLNLPPPHPPPPEGVATTLHHHLPSSSIFDSLSPYFNPFPFAPLPESNSLSLDSTWPRGIQPSSSSSYSTCTTAGPLTAARSPASASASPSSVQPLIQADRPTATPRGPKKRSRASRRAPTTVLNTDTSNFRAMVQQFTGFPTPPFASSPFARPRLDLFNMGATIPPYLLRPSAQKIPTSPFAPMASSSSSSALFDHAIASAARNTLADMNIPMNYTATSSSSSAAPSSSGKCQLSLFDAQQSNSVDVQNTSFIPQSLLQSQTTPQYNSRSLPSTTFRAQPQGPPSEFAMASLGSLISTEGIKLNERTDILSGWADEAAGGQENMEQARSKAVIRNYGNQS